MVESLPELVNGAVSTYAVEPQKPTWKNRLGKAAGFFTILYTAIQLVPSPMAYYDIMREKKAFHNGAAAISLEQECVIMEKGALLDPKNEYAFTFPDKLFTAQEKGKIFITNPRTVESLDILNLSDYILHRFPRDGNEDCSEYASTLFDIYQKIARGIRRPDLASQVRIATGLVDYSEGIAGHSWIEVCLKNDWRQYESTRMWLNGFSREQNLDYYQIRTRFAVTQPGEKLPDVTAIDLSLNPFKGPIPIIYYLAKKITGAKADLTPVVRQQISHMLEKK